jgi:hypothetical protein
MGRTTRQVLQRQCDTLERRQGFLHSRVEEALQGGRPTDRDVAELHALRTAIALIQREIAAEVPFDPRSLGRLS